MEEKETGKGRVCLLWNDNNRRPKGSVKLRFWTGWNSFCPTLGGHHQKLLKETFRSCLYTEYCFLEAHFQKEEQEIWIHCYLSTAMLNKNLRRLFTSRASDYHQPHRTESRAYDLCLLLNKFIYFIMKGMEPHVENLGEREKAKNQLPTILCSHCFNFHLLSFILFLINPKKSFLKLAEIISVFINAILKYIIHINIDLMPNVIKLKGIIMEQQMITCSIWSNIASNCFIFDKTEMFYFQHICTLFTQPFSNVKGTTNTNISSKSWLVVCSWVIVVLLLLVVITVLGNINNQKLLIIKAYSTKSFIMPTNICFRTKCEMIDII